LRASGAAPQPVSTGDELAALSRVSQAVGQLRDVASILERALEEAVGTTNRDAGAIMFIEQSTGRLTLAVQCGLPQDALREAIEASPLENNPLSRQLVARATIISHPALNLASLAPPVASLLQQERIHALLAVPIVHKAKVIGQMDLYVRRPKNFAAFNSAALTAMAEQIGTAIYSTGVRTELEQKKIVLEHVLAASTDGFLVVNFREKDAVVTLANNRFAELFGVPHDQLDHCGLDQLRSLLAPCLVDPAAFDKHLQPLWNDPDNEQHGELVLQRPRNATLEYFTTPTRDDLKRAKGRLWLFREASGRTP
jgi:PAS domain-containing protein